MHLNENAGAAIGLLTHRLLPWLFVDRVSSDSDFARRLYDELCQISIDTGHKMRVYLDQIRLEDGQRWDKGFMRGLSNSMVFVPIVSTGSVGPMAKLAPLENDFVDNVLLEWSAALELHQRGRIRAVLPVLIGRPDFFADATAEFGGVSGLPPHMSTATVEKVGEHLAETTLDDRLSGLSELVRQTSGHSEPTIQGVVSSLLKFQGVKVNHETLASPMHRHGSDGNAEDMRECVDRVVATVSSCLKRLGPEDDNSMQRTSPPSSPTPRSGNLPRSTKIHARSHSSSSSDDPHFDLQHAAGDVEIQFGEVNGNTGLYLSTN